MAGQLPETQAMPNSTTEKSGMTMSRESFADAYNGGFRLTVRLLRSKGASADQAEEVAQSAWARGWEVRGQLLAPELVLPWVNSIAYHRLCSGHRRSSKHVALTDRASASHSGLALRAEARTLLNRCKPHDRALLIQRYYEGLGIREIAERLGMSEVAVRVRIHRCQNGLRAFATGPVSGS